MAASDSEARPLDGLRVVDLADEKGELCGRLLADLGADVLRVEPEGDARSRTTRTCSRSANKCLLHFPTAYIAASS
jgi:crotonobetainyl-CoA:carnitine CoA-transferase CaiB-like acyl-CoA transferase